MTLDEYANACAISLARNGRVVIHDHHPGFIPTGRPSRANQRCRLAQSIHPRPHQAGGAVREGAALLQGIAKCGGCGRGLRVYYSGRHSAPGYYCAGNTISNGRGEWCLRVGGRQIDAAVAEALLAALAPAGLEAALKALPEQMWNPTMTVCSRSSNVKWNARRVSSTAGRAPLSCRSIPKSRLVARGLEAESGNRVCTEVQAARAELTFAASSSGLAR